MMAPTIVVPLFLFCTIVSMIIQPSTAFDFTLAESNNGNEYKPAYAAAKETEQQTEPQTEAQSGRYRDMLRRVQNSLRIIYKGKGKSYADFVSNPLWQQDGPQANPEANRCPPFLVGQVEGC